CKTGESYRGYEFVEEIMNSDRAQGRIYLLEGYLSPNTYEVYTSATADDIIKKLLNQTNAAYLSSYAERAESLGLTMDEIFTMASMIETEAKKMDFAKVSAVFHNRLKQNMTMGSDATVKYVSGSEKMSLSETDLTVQSPYNTYLVHGLPVGPICNPSMDAVVAALYPDEQFLAQKYLFFCSKDPNSSELYFSRTMEEHTAAVAMYRPLWEEYDRSRGL
ncbi:MAG: endolytic transglycosylase MltG, partial [Clostridia bacterium]|nr:endolytic transglycosylase MltG [Clostridia bacterium]